MIVVKNLNGKETDKLRKSAIQIFKNFGFKIEIKTNPIEGSFLGVAFNLNKGTFRPYQNLNNNLSCMNGFPNHLSNIIKRLPNSINDLLSRKSSIKDTFCNTKEDYQKALDKSGNKSRLLYKESNSNNTNNKENNSIDNTSSKQRKRKIIWFNPPCSKSIVTNVAKIFLKLLDKHFSKNAA